MLELFQEQMSASQMAPYSLIGAAIRGDMKILEMATSLFAATGQEESVPDDTTDTDDLQRLSSENLSERTMAILAARSYARLPSVYDFLAELLPSHPHVHMHLGLDLNDYAYSGTWIWYAIF